ncbi:MAG TPA: tail fiber domain-containing protein [Leadbetterella sp.]|nr:tail fiber domain-containing protein [Leadbetterella sp.]
MQKKFNPFILIFLSSVCFGQSVSLTPTINNQTSSTLFGNGSINYSGFRGGNSVGTATFSNAQIVGIHGRGYDGSEFSFSPNAYISLNAAETFSPTANGTNISFWTTQIGSKIVSEKMLINDVGNVGIGTNTFSIGEKLAIKSASVQFGIYPGYLDGASNSNWTTFEMPLNRGLRVWDNFSVNGNVGIRMTDALATLDVARGTAPHGTARLSGTQWNSSFNSATNENTYIQSGKNNSSVVINRFGIGTRTSIGNEAKHYYELEIHPSGYIAFALFNQDDSHLFNFTVCDCGFGADLFLGTFDSSHGYFDDLTGDYYNYSDRKVKKNISYLENVMSKVVQLKPSTYEYISNNPQGNESIGLIAQELEPLFPELVGSMSDKVGNRTKAVDYSSLSSIAQKAIQEQHEIIENLLQQNNDLKTRNKNVASRLAILEKLISEK